MSDLINLGDGLKTSGKWSDVISKRKTTQEWIPLKEKLPNDEQRVLLSSRGGVELVTWDEDSKRLYRDCRNLIVAWMPLPTPWKGEENDK